MRPLREVPDALIALALGGAQVVLYVLFPSVGYRGWDALMTASVLARPSAVSLREVLYFAHPLVIPLTRPFFLLTRDPLAAPALRETFFGAVVVVFTYLGVRAAEGSRRAAVIAALVLTFATMRWRLATSGEEKEVALAFGGAFVLLCFDHRGLWTLGLRRWSRLGAATRECLLGLLLAMAMAVHLQNSLLVPVVLADALLDKRHGSVALRGGVRVLLVAALVAGTFFLCIAVGLGGARSPLAALEYYLPYHLAGRFSKVPTVVGGRIVVTYLAGRTWLIGGHACPSPLLETVVMSGVAVVLIARAWRVHAVVPRLVVWIGVTALHYAFFAPSDPEGWGPAAMAWSIVGALGLEGTRRSGRGLLVGALLVAGLVVSDARALVADRRRAAPVAAFAEGRAPSPAPMADLARWVDHHLPADAILLVDGPKIASYFHIYTRREPIIPLFLDHAPGAIEALYTTLGARFYETPWLSTERIRAAHAEGRPIYRLTDLDVPLERPIDLRWMNNRIGEVGPPDGPQKM